MEQSLQSSTNGVVFRRPTSGRDLSRFAKRVWRSLEWYGRVKAARALTRHGHADLAKNLLEDNWK